VDNRNTHIDPAVPRPGVAALPGGRIGPAQYKPIRGGVVCFPAALSGCRSGLQALQAGLKLPS
jgi:hypothetical protein